MTDTMRAAVWPGVGDDLRIEQIPVPEPKAGEIPRQGGRRLGLPHRPARDEGRGRLPDAGGHGARDSRHGRRARPWWGRRPGRKIRHAGRIGVHHAVRLLSRSAAPGRDDLCATASSR